MRYIIRNYNESGSFEVEALTNSRLRKLIEAECHDRNWIVDDTWAEEVKDEPKPMPYWRQKERQRKQARDVR
jgi:hypothetical protein